jgi:hypothetical protein
MRMRRIGLAIVLMGVVAAAPGARAADPAAPGGIVGSDALGDKSRSGPDGWAQAPVTRNEAPAGRAPGQTAATSAAAPNARPEAPGGKTLPPGEDPGTPAAPQASGPGKLDSTHSP